MNKTIPILKRELFSYFASPMGYIILAAYIFLTAAFFNHYLDGVMQAVQRGTGTMMAYELRFVQYLFNNIMVIMLLIAPAITMRSIAEEKSTGTIQLLLTSPVRDSDVVFGKFGAAFLFFLSLIGASVIFPIIMSVATSQLDWGRVASAYCGIILLAGLFSAGGVLISSLVESQIVAAILTLAALVLGNWILDQSGTLFPGRISAGISYFSFNRHIVPFFSGVIVTEHVVFFVSVIALLLFFSVKSLEKRKWSNLLEDEVSRRLFSLDPFWTGALFLWGLFILLFMLMPSYDRISMGIFVVGCILAFIWVVRRRKELDIIIRSKKGMAGANVIISSVFALIIFIVISVGNVEFNKRWDVTLDKIRSLSPETLNMLEQMNTEIEIITFRSKHQSLTILDWYRRASSKVHVVYLDPVYNRSEIESITRSIGQSTIEDYLLVLNYNATQEALEKGEDPYKKAQLINLRNIQPRLTVLEEEIDLRILTIFHAAEGIKKRKVYFLAGHGEPRLDDTSPNGLSKLAFMLEREFIEYDELFLPGAQKIPGDGDIVISIGAQVPPSDNPAYRDSPFSLEEIRMIREYLNTERRNLFVMAGPRLSRVSVNSIVKHIPKIPMKQFIATGGLIALLAEEGIAISNGMILHDEFHLPGDNSALLMWPIPGNEITQQKKYNMIIPESTPLFLSSTSDKNVRPFIFTPKETWMEDILTSNRTFDPDKEFYFRRGFCGAYSYSKSQDGTPDRRIAVIGSAKMATNHYIDMKNNREIIRDTINWLLNKEHFSINRNFTRIEIALSDSSRNIIFYISVMVVPFVFLGIATLVWWDRR